MGQRELGCGSWGPWEDEHDVEGDTQGLTTQE